MDILQKIRNQPKHIRKIIFWSALILLGLGLLFFWSKDLSKKFDGLKNKKFLEEFKISEFKAELNKIPKPSDEDLKKIEELMQEVENNKNQK